MAKTVQLTHPQTKATIAGTITDQEYEFYVSQGYEEGTDETPSTD